MRRLLLTLALLSPSTAEASGLDVAKWLRRPGVKLLAVEFYATWCKPCMEAVPKWKALHERYKKDGLRLVVVATQDPQGGCVNPGGSPSATDHQRRRPSRAPFTRYKNWKSCAVFFHRHSRGSVFACTGLGRTDSAIRAAMASARPSTKVSASRSPSSRGAVRRVVMPSRFVDPL